MKNSIRRRTESNTRRIMTIEGHSFIIIDRGQNVWNLLYTPFIQYIGKRWFAIQTNRRHNSIVGVASVSIEFVNNIFESSKTVQKNPRRIPNRRRLRLAANAKKTRRKDIRGAEVKSEGTQRRTNPSGLRVPDRVW